MTDFVRAFQASVEMGHWAACSNGSGVEGYCRRPSDPELPEQLSQPLNDDFGVVPNPTENLAVFVLHVSLRVTPVPIGQATPVP